MATSSNVTPRLRMTRHLSTPHDNTTHTVTSLSEAGPSRLPEFSQLVDVSMRDVDISDDNIYASDVPTLSTRQGLPPATTVTKAESPAAVLRTLLSRLPNRDEIPTRPHEQDNEQYLSEKESNSDFETASATTSVAQASLKGIFSRALREPGNTPRKDRSHRRRSSSIGGTDLEDTPHVMEARDIKGKRRTLSDDEVDNASRFSPPRSRLKGTPQLLTQEFLRERFGRTSNSVAKRQESKIPHNNEIAVHGLASSQTTPPAATSTPQRSLMSFDPSRFHSNLLDQDSEMQNAFDAVDNSTDNFSDRSISPVPTLRIEAEHVKDNVTTRLNEITDSTIHAGNRTSQTALQGTQRQGSKSLPTSVPSTAKASRLKLTGYDKQDSLGEQSMSLSLPAEHIKLQPDLDHSRLAFSSHGSLTHRHSATSLRPSSPMPDHRRPCTPVDPAHERERNWNKPHPVRPDSSSSHRSPSPMHHGHGFDSSVDALHEREQNRNSPHPTWHDGLSPRKHSSPRPQTPNLEYHRPETPIEVMHERERNWNAPKPKWHNGVSLHPSKENSLSVTEPNSSRSRANSFHNLSHESSHRPHSPNSTRKDPTRPLSPLPHEKSSLTRTTSLQGPDHTFDSRSRSHLRSSSPLSLIQKVDSSPIVVNGKKRPATPTKVSRISRTNASSKSLTRNQGIDDAEALEQSRRAKNATSFYTWPPTSPDDPKDTPESVLNRQPLARDSEPDDVRDTDLSSQSDTPKSREIEPHEMSDSQDQPSKLSKVRSIELSSPHITIPENASPDIADSLVSPSTPPPKSILKNNKLEFRTPSPPKTLPDLPTPSSSDESNNSPVRMSKVPKLGTPHQNKWMQTPKPPGAWFATPKAPVKSDVGDVDDLVTSISNDEKLFRYPTTPATADLSHLPTTTPKPPGGWATPAPVSLKPGESSSPEDDVQHSQLLTPINSLSKGSALNSKTPGVPGGWVNTPAAKKSVLKVRFDSESPQVKEETSSNMQGSSFESPDELNVLGTKDHSQADDASTGLPSPRSPRRSKPNIRVLDAFGRETPTSSPKKDSTASRSGIRVLDAMGNEVEEEAISSRDISEVEDSGVPATRRELLSRLKLGLDDLVDDIDHMNQEKDILGSDLSRIEQLVATSTQAREARERLISESRKSTVNLFLRPSFISLSRKSCIALALVQVVILFLMYHLSIIRARNLFFNAYYDPFSPELHSYIFKSDNTLHLPLLDSSSPSWPKALLREGGGIWSTWFEALVSSLTLDVQQSYPLAPT